MLDRNALGRTSPPVLIEVEKGAIRRFAEASGDLNPSYFDTEYARASGFPGVVAPASFPIAFVAGIELQPLLGVPSKSLLLSDFTVDLERPIVAGDRLLVRSCVADVTTRPSPSGKVEVALVEDEGRDGDGHLVFRARRTYVVRGAREV